MLNSQITPENLEKFKKIEPDIIKSLKKAELAGVETVLNICNRNFDNSSDQNLAMFSAKHQIDCTLESDAFSFNFNFYLMVKDNDTMCKNDRDLKEIDIVNNRTAFFTDHDLFDATQMHITPKTLTAQSNIGSIFNVSGDACFKMYDGKEIGINHNMNSDKNTLDFQFVCFVIDTLNNEIANSVNSDTFKILKTIEQINKEGINDAINSFSRGLAAMSL